MLLQPTDCVVDGAGGASTVEQFVGATPTPHPRSPAQCQETRPRLSGRSRTRTRAPAGSSGQARLCPASQASRGGSAGSRGVGHSGGSVSSPTRSAIRLSDSPQVEGPHDNGHPRVFRSSTPPTIAGSIGRPSPLPNLSVSRGCIGTAYCRGRAGTVRPAPPPHPAKGPSRRRSAWVRPGADLASRAAVGNSSNTAIRS